jgi:hypothetical protein
VCEEVAWSAVERQRRQQCRPKMPTVEGFQASLAILESNGSNAEADLRDLLEEQLKTKGEETVTMDTHVDRPHTVHQCAHPNPSAVTPPPPAMILMKPLCRARWLPHGRPTLRRGASGAPRNEPRPSLRPHRRPTVTASPTHSPSATH